MKLNLGAGSDLIHAPGGVNVDAVEGDGIDLVHDLNEFPWPFDTCSVDEVKMFHVLEHLEDVEDVMEELWRILKPGGVVRIEVPHFTSFHATTHPQHKHCFHHDSFRMFTAAADEPYTDRLWKRESVEIRPHWLPIKKIVNLNGVTRHWFTATPLQYLLPQANIYYELTPVKELRLPPGHREN